MTLESNRVPAGPSRLLRWTNGSVHWISGGVLLYAFISNGETTRAMINPAAMRGEVKLGVAVGILFVVRLIWVRSRRAAGGRWAARSLEVPRSQIRWLMDSSIYVGVAATVASGLLIAYLRPHTQVIPGARFFMSRSPTLNATIRVHVFVVAVLQWLCALHVVYFVWFWKIRKTSWGQIIDRWLERATLVADRWPVMRAIKGAAGI